MSNAAPHVSLCAWLSDTYWHRDTSRPDAWPIPTSRIVKAFIYINDVSEDGGPLAVVPGSFRLPCGPWETTRQSFKSSMTLDACVQCSTHQQFDLPS